MPELPEVETVRQGLADVLEGRRLHRVQAMRPDLRFPLPENFEGRLSGRQVEKLARRGKYLLIHLQERLTLIAHLGMSGRFRIFNTSPPPLWSLRPRMGLVCVSMTQGVSDSWIWPTPIPWPVIKC